MPRPRSTDQETTRQAIVATAEELFRIVGYHKTTLADIASRLGMSTANIYRFFRSKQEINGCICDKLIGELESMWPRSIKRKSSATEKLKAFWLAYHRHGRSHFISNQGLFDMVAAAMDENWPTILNHVERLTGFVEAIVRAGMEQGEFQTCDTRTVADFFLQAVHPFIDPRRVDRTLKDCASFGTPNNMERDLVGIITLLARGLSPQLPQINL